MSKYRGYVSAMALAIGLLLLTSTHAAAVDAVRCVLWQGDTAKYHTAVDGQSIKLMAVITSSDPANVWYQWSFGDGSPDSNVTQLSTVQELGDSSNLYPLEEAHTYAGYPAGTQFIAVLKVADNAQMNNAETDTFLVGIAENNLDARVNMAIDKGLWRLYKWMNFTDGVTNTDYYYTFNSQPAAVWHSSGSYVSETASVIQAFMINNHKATGNHTQDPFAQAVAWGLNWLFNGYDTYQSEPMLRSFDVSAAQEGEYAEDYNDDGQLDAADVALGANNRGIEVGSNPCYQGGMIIDAIIASGTPNADTGRDINMDNQTDTYKEVVQDMVDAYVWGQGSTGSWRYSWNSTLDNSAAQWAAIGIIPAEDEWGCYVPQWVKTRNNISLNNSYAAFDADGSVHPDGIYGRFGYTSSTPYTYGGTVAYGGHATTPSGMIMMMMDGYTTADERWQKCERWLAENWETWLNYSYSGNPALYGYFAFAKSMRLAKPFAVETLPSSGLDWYRGSSPGLADKLISLQQADGQWDDRWVDNGLPTSWGVIILKPALFSAAPIARFTAAPNPTYANSPVSFDPALSDHSETGKDIRNLTLFEWDFDQDGQYDDSSTVPEVVTHAFACATMPDDPCIYPVTLRVTDDENLRSTATQNVVIDVPPHPPAADTGGPYLVSRCENDELILDGSGSFDPNTGDPDIPPNPDDRITAWGWDLTQPNTEFNDRTGVDQPVPVTLNMDDVDQLFTEGLNNIGLKVTDNTALSYPGEGQQNLTNTAFTTVEVYDGCICELTAVPRCTTADLAWDDIGAERYDVYRSVTGINSGFRQVGSTTDNTATVGLLPEATNYYRVMAVNPGSTGQGGTVVLGTGPEEEDAFCLSRAIAVDADPGQCLGHLRIPPGSQIGDYIMVTLTNVCDDYPNAEDVLGIPVDPTQFMMGTYNPNFPEPEGTGGYIEYGNGLTFEIGRSNWVLSRQARDVVINCNPVTLEQDVDVPLWYNPLRPYGTIQVDENGEGNGWNQIGCPNAADYNWTEVIVVERNDNGAQTFAKPIGDPDEYIDTLVDRRLWSWLNGYFTDHTELRMEAGNGYFAKAKKRNVSLRFPMARQMLANHVKDGQLRLADLIAAGAQRLQALDLGPRTATADSGDRPPQPMGNLLPDPVSDSSAGGGCFISTSVAEP